MEQIQPKLENDMEISNEFERFQNLKLKLIPQKEDFPVNSQKNKHL